MKKCCIIAAAVLLTAIAGTSFVTANNASEGEGYCITVSPKTLVLSSPDTIVSVHSNIPYSAVDVMSLTLNGIDASYTKTDNQGCLVVKFGRADIQGTVSPGQATVTLCGLLSDGEPFEASDTITVKE